MSTMSRVGAAVAPVSFAVLLSYVAYSGELHSYTGRRGQFIAGLLRSLVDAVGVYGSIAIFMTLGLMAGGLALRSDDDVAE
jgi:hypothetical protein